MGNKLCKKKTDTVDGNNPKSQPFVRIMSRLRLKPRWKSDSHLEQKRVNRYEVPPQNGSLPQPPRPLSISKSSDWTEVPLEVPNDNEIQLKHSELTFSDEMDGTPQPPPRKHKKGFREKIEAVAKSSIQALQSKKPVEEPLKPVEEPIFIKRTINYDCPTDYRDEKAHNRDHKHPRDNLQKTSTPKITHKLIDRDAKRKKNLSVVSLPNYSDLKFSLANNGENIDKTDSDLRQSAHSLPGETKKIITYPEKRDYITRCRSFGSSLPQLLLHKLTNAKAPLAEIESDDSFGGLEDWDLKIIEHYNPKDSSLPRNTKPMKLDREIISDLESLIVKEEDIDPPKPPVRRSESLVKKINKSASESARKISSGIDSRDKNKGTPMSLTPPPSPEREVENSLVKLSLEDLPTQDEEGNVEHSTLLKILQDFSMKEVQQKKSLSRENEINLSNPQTVQNNNEKNVRNQLENAKNQAENLNNQNDRYIFNNNKIFQDPVMKNDHFYTKDSFAVNDFLNAERQHLTNEHLNKKKIHIVDMQA